MLNWKDVSSYSQSDKVRTPHSFEPRCGQFRLYIHHYFGCGDTWFTSCRGVFDIVQLKSKDIEEAKVEAADLLKKLLTEALEKLND
jgi:hypothetical protein